MPNEKLLAEWFWIDRWMGSSAFALPIAARGLYREMLSQGWLRRASLPNDPEQIRRMTGVTLAEWQTSWPLVKRYWRVTARGKSLSNDTQKKVYLEALSRQKKATARARKAAKARWDSENRDPRADAQASHVQSPPISDLRSPSQELLEPAGPEAEYHLLEQAAPTARGRNGRR